MKFRCLKKTRVKNSKFKICKKRESNLDCRNFKSNKFKISNRLYNETNNIVILIKLT